MIFNFGLAPAATGYRGFGFIELLVVWVIISVGLAALVALQRTFLHSTSRVIERSVALEIAQQQLATMHFNGYAELVAGSQTHSRNGTDYLLSWGVTAVYYAGGWRPHIEHGLADSLPVWATAKVIHLRVSWITRGAVNQVLTLESWLAPMGAANRAQNQL